MRLTLSPLALALAALMLGACTPASQDASTDAAKTDATTPAAADTAKDAAADATPADPLDAILAGDWRDPANSARDASRHPRETLTFFGVGPSQTVIEISPGAGQGSLHRRAQRPGQGRQRARVRVLRQGQPGLPRQAGRPPGRLRQRQRGGSGPGGAGVR
jgi:hypothetical protein